ncbi:type II secretion system F family protein [Nocardiopsis oceani]
MFFEVVTVVCAVTGVWILTGSERLREQRAAKAPPRVPPGRVGTGALLFAGACGAAVLVAVFGALGAAVAVGGCVLLWVRARRARTRPDRLPVTDDLPVLIGLIASGIRAGATVPACLSAVSGAARGALGTELAMVAERLRLGADPAPAWQRSALPDPLVAVGRDLARASETGAPVADLLDRHVADLRRELRSRATAKVERLGVLVVAPLGLCFLPAFLLIGVVPMAAELLTAALGH